MTSKRLKLLFLAMFVAANPGCRQKRTNSAVRDDDKSVNIDDVPVSALTAEQAISLVAIYYSAARSGNYAYVEDSQGPEITTLKQASDLGITDPVMQQTAVTESQTVYNNLKASKDQALIVFGKLREIADRFIALPEAENRQVAWAAASIAIKMRAIGGYPDYRAYASMLMPMYFQSCNNAKECFLMLTGMGELADLVPNTVIQQLTGNKLDFSDPSAVNGIATPFPTLQSASPNSVVGSIAQIPDKWYYQDIAYWSARSLYVNALFYGAVGLDVKELRGQIPSIPSGNFSPMMQQLLDYDQDFTARYPAWSNLSDERAADLLFNTTSGDDFQALAEVYQESLPEVLASAALDGDDSDPNVPDKAVNPAAADSPAASLPQTTPGSPSSTPLQPGDASGAALVDVLAGISSAGPSWATAADGSATPPLAGASASGGPAVSVAGKTPVQAARILRPLAKAFWKSSMKGLNEQHSAVLGLILYMGRLGQTDLADWLNAMVSAGTEVAFDTMLRFQNWEVVLASRGPYNQALHSMVRYFPKQKVPNPQVPSQTILVPRPDLLIKLESFFRSYMAENSLLYGDYGKTAPSQVSNGGFVGTVIPRNTPNDNTACASETYAQSYYVRHPLMAPGREIPRLVLAERDLTNTFPRFRSLHYQQLRMSYTGLMFDKAKRAKEQADAGWWFKDGNFITRNVVNLGSFAGGMISDGGTALGSLVGLTSPLQPNEYAEAVGYAFSDYVTQYVIMQCYNRATWDANLPSLAATGATGAPPSKVCFAGQTIDLLETCYGVKGGTAADVATVLQSPGFNFETTVSRFIWNKAVNQKWNQYYVEVGLAIAQIPFMFMSGPAASFLTAPLKRGLAFTLLREVGEKAAVQLAVADVAANATGAILTRASTEALSAVATTTLLQDTASQSLMAAARSQMVQVLTKRFWQRLGFNFLMSSIEAVPFTFINQVLTAGLVSGIGAASGTADPAQAWTMVYDPSKSFMGNLANFGRESLSGAAFMFVQGNLGRQFDVAGARMSGLINSEAYRIAGQTIKGQLTKQLPWIATTIGADGLAFVSIGYAEGLMTNLFSPEGRKTFTTLDGFLAYNSEKLNPKAVMQQLLTAAAFRAHGHFGAHFDAGPAEADVQSKLLKDAAMMKRYLDSGYAPAEFRKMFPKVSAQMDQSRMAAIETLEQKLRSDRPDLSPAETTKIAMDVINHSASGEWRLPQAVNGILPPIEVDNTDPTTALFSRPTDDASSVDPDNR